MKKCALLLVVVTVLAFVFGGAAFAADKKIVVGFAQIGAESDWRVASWSRPASVSE